MNPTLSSLVILFVIAGCQGRGLPMHSANPLPAAKKMYNDTANTTNIDSNNNTNISQSFPKLTLKGESLANNTSLFQNIPIVNKISADTLPDLNKIPILRDMKKLLPQSGKVSKKRVHQKAVNNNYTPNSESFSGGKISNNLDIGMVRLGQSSTYTRLIFDTYKWAGYAQIPVEKANHSGIYIFTYDPKKKRIVAILDGYQAFSALVGDHEDLYEGNKMVSTIHLDEYLDQSGFKFTIELKQEAQVKVYELDNPGRIIIDMMPL